eukprot:3013712-Lingulodinium_polyedra.AAC.1
MFYWRRHALRARTRTCSAGADALNGPRTDMLCGRRRACAPTHAQPRGLKPIWLQANVGGRTL